MLGANIGFAASPRPRGDSAQRRGPIVGATMRRERGESPGRSYLSLTRDGAPVQRLSEARSSASRSASPSSPTTATHRAGLAHSYLSSSASCSGQDVIRDFIRARLGSPPVTATSRRLDLLRHPLGGEPSLRSGSDDSGSVRRGQEGPASLKHDVGGTLAAACSI